MGIRKHLSMLVALTKFLTFLKSSKIITSSHSNSINFSDNFEGNFMREKVNKMASKAKSLNICALEPNKNEFMMTQYQDVKNVSHGAVPNFNQHWSC